MYLLLISLFILNCLIIFVSFILGFFVVNGISAFVLFNSGATRSFVSLALRKRFVGVPGELDCPLDIEIVDERFVRVASSS